MKPGWLFWWLGCGLDDHRTGAEFPQGSRVFSVLHSIQICLGLTQPCSYCIPWMLSAEAKQSIDELDHSSPSSAKVEVMWSHTSTCMSIMFWCLVKHMANFMLQNKILRDGWLLSQIVSSSLLH